MMNGDESITWAHLKDFSRGIEDDDPSPLQNAANSVCKGENLELVGPKGQARWRTRGGSAYTSQGSLPSATVMMSKQIRFPTNTAKYFLSQIDSGSINKIYISADNLPGTLEFSELYDLEASAGPLSVSVLNDRAVLTEGINQPPLVFAGCQQEDGSDWAVPKAVLLSFDGTNYEDISRYVCDKDADTVIDLGSFPTAGYLAICTDMPLVDGFYLELGSGGANANAAVMTCQGYNGSWTAGDGWTDGTIVSGKSLGQTGVITYDGASPFSASYHEVYWVPGFWYRISWDAVLSASCSLSRVLFKAPCQPLQVIGDGQPDQLLGFVWYDDSTGASNDYTVEVSTRNLVTKAKLYDDTVPGAPVAMAANVDYWYAGYLTKFHALMVTPAEKNNRETAVLSGEYWDGDSWSSLSITDGTAAGGCTIAQKGDIEWSAPSDWKECRPLDGLFPLGYWVRFKVSAQLSDKVEVAECRAYAEPDALKKHKFAISVRDRMMLLNRPDAPDQIDITRKLEEYGMHGADSSSLRIGGQDDIIAAKEAWNQGFIAKWEKWFLLNGYNPQTFACEGAETASQTPINNQCVVRGPYEQPDGTNKMGLYFLNLHGAWHFTGVQVYSLSSKRVKWWDEAASNPRIDLDYLHLACGVYWPARNWVIWSVPMITGSGSSQTTCNRLIVYDLTYQCWLPPFTRSLASLCTAYHYHATAPGNRGGIGLYGGDYSGNILRLFGPDATDDCGTDIAGWFETSWLDFGSSEWTKEFRWMSVYGRGAISCELYTGGDPNEAQDSIGFDELNSTLVDFSVQTKPIREVKTNFLKLKMIFDEKSDLYGIGVAIHDVRDLDRI